MKRLILAALATLAFATPAAAQFDFRTTGTRSARVLEVTCTATAAPAVAAANMGKIFVPCAGISGYSAGNIYISQNTGPWTLLSSFVGSGAVSSVFGRTGAIVAQSGDYNATLVTVTPSGNIAAANVGAAISELDSEKVPATRTLTAGTGLSGGGDLSANRTLTLANTTVSPGTYTHSTITVDAQGRLTSASSGTAGDVAGPAASVDSELALYSGTSGKTLKRATGSGIALVTSGVFSTFATSAGLASALSDETGSGAAVFAGSPALTGTPTAPTAATATNTTQLATTAFVQGEAVNVTGDQMTGDLEIAKTDAALLLTGASPVSTTARMALQSLGASADTHISANAKSGGGVWSRQDTSRTSWNFFISPSTESAKIRRTNAGAGSITWTDLWTLDSSGNITIAGTVRPRNRNTADGEWLAVAHNAANFAAFGGGTFGVDAADQATFAYTLINKTMTVSYTLLTTTVSGSPAELYIAIPGGFTAARRMDSAIGLCIENGATCSGYVAKVSGAGAAAIVLYKPSGAAWTNSTNNNYFGGQITFEIQYVILALVLPFRRRARRHLLEAA
jgi:hypothetical protein